MKTASANLVAGVSRRAFTLAELVVAMAIGLGLSGIVVLLLVQSGTEERHGFADTTVEEKAYTLEANLAGCLRSMSASQGFWPISTSTLVNSNGNLLGYQSILVFSPSNGAYTTASINFNSNTGQVIYTPNVLTPAVSTVWMSNSATAALTEFYFSYSFNLDSSQNNSLINVVFQMNDNGFSQQPSNNNPASILRSFSVQMRNDN